MATGALAATSPWGVSAAAADTILDTPLRPGAPEPNVDAAKHWWHPARQVWTPIGWKGHMFRFNCFYNGTMVCEPSTVMAAKPNVQPYAGKNFQLTVTMPRRDGSWNPFPTHDQAMWDEDLGYRKQGWATDQQTPVLWTEYRRQEGVVLRQSVFAHLPGGQDVDTAVEPLYAWMRFEIVHVDEVKAPKEFTVGLWLSKAFAKFNGPFDQQHGVEVYLMPELAPMAGPLRTDRIYNPTGKPMSVPVFDSDDNIRLMVGTPQGGSIALTPNTNEGIYDLRLGLPAEVGTAVDIMVPMMVAPADEARAEFALGRAAALAECESFWAPKAATVADVQTPEDHLNQLLRRGPQLAQVVAEKSTDTGLYTFLSGSYAYDVLWSTPTSMVSHMFLDLLGYHDVVEQHIEIYHESQGSRVPPGTIFAGGNYPGFLSTPKQLQAIDWLSDHGAILETISVHALLTNRKAFIDRWLDPIVKACDFIVQACAMTNHNGVKGLMPPGFATDETIDTQGVNIQCFTYKGLTSAIALLRRVRHPRAHEFAAFAARFRSVYQQALRDMAQGARTWTDATGLKQPVLQPSFTDEATPWEGMTRYDTGPLMSVWAGLMPASDPLMVSFLDFFRSGPDVALFDEAHHNALDRVILQHEVGSGEPCYSWSMMHNWQLGDRVRYLEGMYGLVTGALSQDTFISCEHRNAIYGNLFAHPLIVWSLRHAVVDDDIDPDRLHLLRMCPQGWVTDSQTRFDRMPTRFGPIDLRIQRSADGRTVDLTVHGSWHHRPAGITVHTAALAGARRLRVNGKTHPLGHKETIDL
ncbi:hypothetical protein [Nakamurella lactea]|uniref:hypothetical protein n=1 Tax=Nakamurella lactea TaxID=459515 RepID=UPI000415D9EB|nr:hypothetical protein [Nakamurella lactea]